MTVYYRIQVFIVFILLKWSLSLFVILSGHTNSAATRVYELCSFFCSYAIPALLTIGVIMLLESTLHYALSYYGDEYKPQCA